MLPNKIWHADITEFRTKDGLKAFIYLLIDNCSRYILSWRVSLKKSDKIRMETIKEAYFKYIMPPPPDPPIGLLVDGGSENKNEIIDDFLKREDVSIEKIIAQVDIRFSNSMIESTNKILKYRHLYLHEIENIDSLTKQVETFVNNFNNEIPNGVLKGLTPKEVFRPA